MSQRGKIRDLAKNSYTKPQFIKSVKRCLKKEAKDGKSVVAGLANTFSDTTLRRAIAAALPERGKVSTKMADRRCEALLDPFNAVSLMATWPAVITEDDVTDLRGGYGVINRKLLFNVDATNVYVGDETVDRVYCAEGSTAALAELNLSVGTRNSNAETSQRRSVQLVALTTADGDLPLAVVKIRDNVVKKCYTKKVSYLLHHQFHFLQYVINCRLTPTWPSWCILAASMTTPWPRYFSMSSSPPPSRRRVKLYSKSICVSWMRC